MSWLLTISVIVRTGILICFSDLGEHFTCHLKPGIQILNYTFKVQFFHSFDKVLGVFLLFFLEGVAEVLKFDALTLQKSIGSILKSLACPEVNQ
jgi:hypothetical protein